MTLITINYKTVVGYIIHV